MRIIITKIKITMRGVNKRVLSLSKKLTLSFSDINQKLQQVKSINIENINTL